MIDEELINTPDTRNAALKKDNLQKEEEKLS